MQKTQRITTKQFLNDTLVNSKWLRNHSPPGMRTCAREVYKTLMPVLLCSAALLVVVLYSLVDQLHSFVCEIFMPQYHYAYAVPLAFIQAILNALALLGLHALRLIRLKPFSLKLAERLMVPAVCGSTQSVLALWAESSAHSGLYSLTARLLPLLCLGWGHLFTLSAPRHAHFPCLLTGVTFASIGVTACKGLYTIETLEYVYSPLSLLLHSLSLTWLTKVSQSERDHASTFDLYYTLMVTRSLLLGFLCILHPDSTQAITHGSWNSLLFLGYMLAMLLLGALQLLLVDVTALRFSALAAALMHSAKEIALPFFNLL